MSAYELLAETRSGIENALGRMLQAKKDGTTRKELPELVTSCSVLFLNLRQINRALLQEEDRIKSETEAAKSPLDHTTLQLHNFLYEKSHYVKAIKACKDFKSKYPDIELVPEEEFFRDAPEEFQADPAVKTDAHKLMLQRLNFEMHQRKQFCKQRELLEARKKMLQENISNRKKFLSSLPSHLKALKKASQPVQQHLGILHTKQMKQHQLADLLPTPLYILYTQLLSYKEAFGEPIDVELSGSTKEAQALLKQQANLEQADELKGDDEMPDEDDDSQRRRKRTKRSHEKDNAGVFQPHPLSVVLQVYDDETSETERLQKLLVLRFEYLYKLSIVCVSVESHHEPDKLNLLANLFPDDIGIELPSQAAKLIANGATLEDSKRNVRCYKWAQHLAGIDFLPEVSEQSRSSISAGLEIYRRQNRVQTVLRQLRARKRAQMALTQQLDCLRKLTKPPLNYKKAPWCVRSEGQLTCWMAKNSSPDAPSSTPVIESEDGELLPNAPSSVRMKQPVKPKPAPMPPALTVLDGDADTLMIDYEMDDAEPEEETKSVPEPKKERAWQDYCATQYYGVLKRERSGECTAELEFTVTISADYPARPPLFKLRLLGGEAPRLLPSVPPGIVDNVEDSIHGEEPVHWFNELRAMEAKVNEVIDHLPSSEDDFVLAHQIAMLCFLFDKQVDGERHPNFDQGRVRRGRERRII